MGYERLHKIKERILECVECQMEHLEEVDANELGEAIDMLKDIEEAVYYAVVTEAMQSKGYTNTNDWCYTRSPHEGRSPEVRKMYLEARDMGKDKTMQVKELEHYMQELSQDIIDMIQDASSDEKQYLEKKLLALASKIGQMK